MMNINYNYYRSSDNRSPFARVDARTLKFKHGEDFHLERLPGHPASKRTPLKRDDGKLDLKVSCLNAWNVEGPNSK